MYTLVAVYLCIILLGTVLAFRLITKERVFSLLYRAFNRGRTPHQVRQQTQQRSGDEELSRVIEQRPSLLPKSRNNLSQASLSPNDHRHSPLFTKLPPGIRWHIFEHALGGNIVYLINIAKLISHKHASIPLSFLERVDVYNRSANDDEEGMDTLQLTRPPKIK